MTTGKRQISTVLAAAAVLSFLLADRVVAASNDAEDVGTVVAGFAATWNRHDLDAFGRLFAANADFVNVQGRLWIGRQSIQAQHAWSHGTIPADSPGFGEEDRRYYGIFKNSTMKFDPVDVRFLRKDVAVAHVDWEMLGDARTQNSRHGVFLFVLTRQDGGWLIATAQNTEINRTVN